MQRYPFLKTFLLFIFLLFFISLSKGFAGWYDPDWSTRRPVIIDNTGNSDILYDFQLGINIPYYPEMQNAFDDIRFTTDDEVTSIPYWVEEYDSSEYVIAWVKAPVIPALDTTLIYLYYGNPDAVNESDGEAVFVFFDDFDDQDISDWNIINGEWIAFNKYLEQLNTANHRKILSSYTFTDASVIEGKMIYISSYLYSGNHILISKDSLGNNGYKFGYSGLNAGGTWIAKIVSGNVYGLVKDSTINVSNYPYIWLKAKFTYNGISKLSFLLRAPDSVQVFLETNDVTFGLPFTLGAYCGSHIGIDNLRVRKYTDPEPNYTIGEEQGIDEEKIHPKFPQSLPILSLISSNLSFPFEFVLELSLDSKVSGYIYDCSGRKIESFMKNKSFSKGKHHLILKRKNQVFSPGIFFLKLIINEHNGKIYYLNEKLLFLQ